MLKLVSQQPETIGRYEIVRPLGRGGMAEVLLGRASADLGFVRLVAIKRLLPELAGDPNVVEMFIDEARIGATLHHNNIAQVFEFGRSEDAYFIAMEYVPGCTLTHAATSAACGAGRLHTAAAAYIVANVCAALDYAHRLRDGSGKPLGIVHRDVKPNNVLLGSEGQVKLIDFGVARAQKRLHRTMENLIKGSVAYMSPEQANGAPLDHRSDIFSCGTLLYAMLTGSNPFAETDERPMFDRVRHARVHPISPQADIPEELRDVCLRALSRLPEDRFQSAALMQAPLDDYCHEAGFGSRQLADWLAETVGDLGPIAQLRTPHGLYAVDRHQSRRRGALLLAMEDDGDEPAHTARRQIPAQEQLSGGDSETLVALMPDSRSPPRDLDPTASARPVIPVDGHAVTEPIALTPTTDEARESLARTSRRRPARAFLLTLTISLMVVAIALVAAWVARGPRATPAPLEDTSAAPQMAPVSSMPSAARTSSTDRPSPLPLAQRPVRSERPATEARRASRAAARPGPRRRKPQPIRARRSPSQRSRTDDVDTERDLLGNAAAQW